MGSQIKVEIGFGLSYDKDGKSLWRTAEAAREAIFSKAIEIFGAYTYYETRGGWKNSKGHLCEEKGGVLFVVVPNEGFEHRAAFDLARFVKEKLNQEAVAVSVTPVNFELI